MQVKIMSGLPGCGKTTLANHLESKINSGKRVVICCADDYHMVNGVYCFDRSKAGVAHDQCYRQFLLALQDEVELLVVDNTNTSVLEIAPYYRPPQAFGHDVEIIRFVVDPLLAHKRNTHGVPLRTIMEMHVRMNEALPSFWNVNYVPVVKE